MPYIHTDTHTRTHAHTYTQKGGKNEKEKFTCAKFVTFACCGCTHFCTDTPHTLAHTVIHTRTPTHTHTFEVVLFDFGFRIICTCSTSAKDVNCKARHSTRLDSTWLDSTWCTTHTHKHTHSLTPTLLAVRVIGSCTYCQQLLVAKRLQEPQRNRRKTNMATFPSWLIWALLLAASRGPTSTTTTTTASAPSRRAASYQTQCHTSFPRSCVVLSFLLRVWPKRERENAFCRLLLVCGEFATCHALVKACWMLPPALCTLLSVVLRCRRRFINLLSSLPDECSSSPKLCKECAQVSGPMSLLALLGKHVTLLGVLSPPLANTENYKLWLGELAL